ncbi:MAG: LPS export ABC transporter periplasmic protein LptC [Alphaproteobacteria bacterium]|nr:LPS export ABC transporter periplasmic protein LptC [Alphaproteobacteria bacterium]
MARDTAALSGSLGEALELAPLGQRRRAGSIGYSRFVQAMKLLLPLAAGGLLLAVLAWPGAIQAPGEFRLSYVAGEPADSPPTMERPRYVGVEGAERRYFITAERATHDVSEQGRIALSRPQADMIDGNGHWLSVIARSGVFRQPQGRLRLEGPVDIHSDLGYELRARSLDLDLKGGTAETAEPVEGQGPLGLMTAERARIAEKGARLWFEGRVKVVLHAGR